LKQDDKITISLSKKGTDNSSLIEESDVSPKESSSQEPDCEGYVGLVPAKRISGEIYILQVNDVTGEREYRKLNEVLPILKRELIRAGSKV